MAVTTGLVQRLTIMDALACAWIGPSPTNTAVLMVKNDAGDSAQTTASKTSMVDALSSAMTARREVSANHADNDSEITSVSINPA